MLSTDVWIEFAAGADARPPVAAAAAESVAVQPLQAQQQQQAAVAVHVSSSSPASHDLWRLLPSALLDLVCSGLDGYSLARLSACDRHARLVTTQADRSWKAAALSGRLCFPAIDASVAPIVDRVSENHRSQADPWAQAYYRFVGCSRAGAPRDWLRLRHDLICAMLRFERGKDALQQSLLADLLLSRPHQRAAYLVADRGELPFLAGMFLLWIALMTDELTSSASSSSGPSVSLRSQWPLFAALVWVLVSLLLLAVRPVFPLMPRRVAQTSSLVRTAWEWWDKRFAAWDRLRRASAWAVGIAVLSLACFVVLLALRASLLIDSSWVSCFVPSYVAFGALYVVWALAQKFDPCLLLFMWVMYSIPAIVLVLLPLYLDAHRSALFLTLVPSFFVDACGLAFCLGCWRTRSAAKMFLLCFAPGLTFKALLCAKVDGHVELSWPVVMAPLLYLSCALMLLAAHSAYHAFAPSTLDPTKYSEPLFRADWMLDTEFHASLVRAGVLPRHAQEVTLRVSPLEVNLKVTAADPRIVRLRRLEDQLQENMQQQAMGNDGEGSHRRTERLLGQIAQMRNSLRITDADGRRRVGVPPEDEDDYMDPAMLVSPMVHEMQFGNVDVIDMQAL